MLIETPQSGLGFRVGDTVQVLSSRQVGKVIGFENGRYKVLVNGAPIMVESSNLERKELLLG